MSMNEEVSLKLLVNKDTNKVIFAEAGKDFVDVLFSFLTMPLGTIARLVQNESNTVPVRVGCLSSLYESVSKLDKECLFTDTCKQMLLRPRNSSEDYCRSMKLNIDDTQQDHYICPNFPHRCNHYMLSTFLNETCACGSLMSRSVCVKSNQVFTGFVKDGATFIITDDLVVKPNALDTCFGIYQSCGVQDLSSVKSMTVTVNKRGVLDLLKCSLLSKSTLTHVFLVKNPLLRNISFYPPFVHNSSNNIKIQVKLIMRKLDGKILFAQGEGNFADFLLSFLTLPLGAVVHMLGGYSSVGSIDGLYKSIVALDICKYCISTDSKSRLVNPLLAHQTKLSKQMFPIDEQHGSKFNIYFSSPPIKDLFSNEFFVTDYKDSNLEVTYGVPKPMISIGSLKSYAKGPAMFMVTDDLVVEPMSPISSLSVLNRLNISFNDLTEKVVFIGIKEGLSILKASLTSGSALTNGLAHLLIHDVKQVTKKKKYDVKQEK